MERRGRSKPVGVKGFAEPSLPRVQPPPPFLAKASDRADLKSIEPSQDITGGQKVPDQRTENPLADW